MKLTPEIKHIIVVASAFSSILGITYFKLVDCICDLIEYLIHKYKKRATH